MIMVSPLQAVGIIFKDLDVELARPATTGDTTLIVALPRTRHGGIHGNATRLLRCGRGQRGKRRRAGDMDAGGGIGATFQPAG